MGTHTCRHCHAGISASTDPNVPWVHDRTGNCFCDVEVPEDAVMFAGTFGRTAAEPREAVA